MPTRRQPPRPAPASRKPTPEPAPAPLPPRLGPRPLPLHFSLSLAAWLNSPAGLILSASGWSAWNRPLRRRAGNSGGPGLFDSLHSASLAQRLLQASPQDSGPALARAVSAKLDRFRAGVERYRAHPYRRTLDDPPVLWQEGGTRLLDFGGTGPPALFVPSLINRAYVLDLHARSSLMRWLVGQGVSPLLLDWGDPGSDERDFTLTDYALRLGRAVQAVGVPVSLVGYCVGGVLALAAAQLQSRYVRRLALLATPWDFHAESREEARCVADLFQRWKPGCAATGLFDISMLQSLFALPDPLFASRKFIRFADASDPEEVERFVALEDWLNDGVPMTLAAADDCFAGCYGRNRLVAEEWMVGGMPVDPAQIDVPTLVMVPEEDRIVPPASTEALAAAIRFRVRTRLRVPLGHVGMIVSRRAPRLVWGPLADWLKRERY